MPSSNLGAVIPQLMSEWKHPSRTLPVLTLIGPDVIRYALAQLSGTPLTPVAFSFGWVAYSFSNLVSTLNGGQLLPQPELSCLVINAKSGYESAPSGVPLTDVRSSYARNNQNWVIARILRDFQYWAPPAVSEKVEQILKAAQENDRAKGRHVPRHKAGLCISVFSCHCPAGKPIHDVVYYSGFFVALLQLVISVVPFVLSGDWVPFLVTFSATILAFAAGALPQWKEEKWGVFPTEKRVVLTRGNGAQHAIVIDGTKDGVDFEALSTLEPAATRATRVGNFTLAILWIVHLITLVEMDQDAWYFMAIGGVGMMHNVFVAGVQRRPEALGIHLRYVECFADVKVMKALQAVEKSHPGVGASMLPIFFPGKLRPDEELFWREQENRRHEVTVPKKITNPSNNDANPPSQSPAKTKDSVESKVVST